MDKFKILKEYKVHLRELESCAAIRLAEEEFKRKGTQMTNIQRERERSKASRSTSYSSLLQMTRGLSRGSSGAQWRETGIQKQLTIIGVTVTAWPLDWLGQRR